MRRSLVLVLLALSLIACDPPVYQPPSVKAGEVMGPCLHDDAHVYHYCSQGTDPDAPRLCAVPQELGIEHAGVCVERRAEGDCLEPIVIDGEPFALTQDEGANACVISCSDSSDCPASMLCSAGMCAYPTFG